MTWSGKKENQIKLVKRKHRTQKKEEGGSLRRTYFPLTNSKPARQMFLEKNKIFVCTLMTREQKFKKSNLFPIGEPRGLKVHLGAMVKEPLYSNFNGSIPSGDKGKVNK